MIVYNTRPKGSTPIVITTEWEADEFGGPANRKKEIMIGPGQGVELDLVGLTPCLCNEPFKSCEIHKFREGV